MATFAELRNAALAEVDSTFAENLRLAFFTSSGAADPARPQRTIKGILRSGAGKSINIGAGAGQNWNTRIYAGITECHIDPIAWPALGIRLKDKVRALDRPGQPVFEVSGIDDRGETRLILKLGNA